MPHLSCPLCGLTIYRATVGFFDRSCPRCKTRLTVNRGESPEAPRPTFRAPRHPASNADLLELYEQIATRIAYGGTLAHVEREIIATCALDETGRSALRVYAENKLHARDIGASTTGSSKSEAAH